MLNETFDELESGNVAVIKWHGYFSVLLIGSLSLCWILSTSGKVMIIRYILTKAPKRPLNRMILHDQVSM